MIPNLFESRSKPQVDEDEAVDTSGLRWWQILLAPFLAVFFLLYGAVLVVVGAGWVAWSGILKPILAALGWRADKEAPISDILVQAWLREEEQPFTGWDFSHLRGRMREEQPPWSYPGRARELLAEASSVLDMGTGGGERLLSLRAAWPAKVAVTEDYPPNVALAKERLVPLGVRVEVVELTRTGPMPFEDSEFDLVLNRHSGFSCAEVARVLAPGGTFLTEQVHALWARDLIAAFDASPPWPDDTPELQVPCLQAAGLTVKTVQEWQGRLTFDDVGAIVYYLHAVPWLVPGFSVKTHMEQLRRLQTRLVREGTLVFEARLFLIEARKPL